MMDSYKKQLELFLIEVAKLHDRHELSMEVGPDYYEPGMMEYLDQFDGSWDEKTGDAVLCFEAKGTRYDGRTEQIEKVKKGDVIRITRDSENEFNPNNFTLFTEKGKNVGNMPAALCNAIAPLYDAGALVIESATVSFVDPISKRSRHAKQAILFVEMHAKLTVPEPIKEDCAKEDPFALQLDLRANSFFIGGHEIHRDMLLDEIRRKQFCEDAKEVQDFLDPKCLRVYLRHTATFADEEWVVSLIFKEGQFRDLWLENSKMFQQRSLLKNAASNPRLRKIRSALYSKLKKRLDEMTGSKGEQAVDNGNQQYIYYFDGHGTMLVQDNHMPSVILYIQYYNQDKATE